MSNILTKWCFNTKKYRNWNKPTFKECPWVGELGQQLKWWLRKCVDQSLDPQHSFHYVQVEVAGTREFPQESELVTHFISVLSRFHWENCFNEWGEESMEDGFWWQHLATICTCLHAYTLTNVTYSYTHLNTHGHVQKAHREKWKSNVQLRGLHVLSLCQPDVAAWSYNPSIGETEAGEFSWVKAQLGLQCEILSR